MSATINRPVGISLIVCCYNSEQRLPQTLKHLADQKLDFGAPVELIIVDNNSSDNTYQYAENEWKRLKSPYPIHLLKEKRQGIAYARITGMNAVQYSLIAFVDDDNWLNPDYLTSGFSIMEGNKKIAVLGGSNIGVFDSNPPSWINQPFPFKSLRYSLAIHNKKDLEGSLQETDYVFGAGSFYRVVALDQLFAMDFKPLLSGRQKTY